MILTAETIIKKAASDFYRSADEHPKKFKNELALALYDHYDSLDKLIFLYEVAKQIDIEYEKHLEKCQHKSNPEKCSQNVNFVTLKYYVEQEIRELNPTADFSILRPNINSDLIRKNLVQLATYSESAKLLQNAIDKLNESRYERNLLDDLRLSLESLLKAVLNN